MKSNYKRLGDYIKAVNRRNINCDITDLRGLSLTKEFRKSTSNIIGTDMSTYKIMHKYDFAANFMGLGVLVDKAAIVLKMDETPNIVSGAYPVFEVKNENELHPEYLMMWLIRSEFDRFCVFKSDRGIRGGFDWNDLLETELPIPSISKQLEIVKEYNVIQNRIALNKQLIKKLEETAQAIYREWFVEGIDLENLPKGWRVGKLSEIATIIMGQSPEGESYNEVGNGSPLINGPVEFGDYFTLKTKWTTEPKKFCKKGDLIFCVRGSTVGKNVIADDRYAIGRGVCTISSKYQFHLIQLVKINLNEILKDVTGSTFPNIDKITLGNYPVVISSDEILDDFEIKALPISQMIRVKAKENLVLTELKDLLLSKLATIEN
jgi:type I restriction enzyme, S subunit